MSNRCICDMFLLFSGGMHTILMFYKRRAIKLFLVQQDPSSMENI
jgi:hypothetical protein